MEYSSLVHISYSEHAACLPLLLLLVHGAWCNHAAAAAASPGSCAHTHNCSTVQHHTLITACRTSRCDNPSVVNGQQQIRTEDASDCPAAARHREAWPSLGASLCQPGPTWPAWTSLGGLMPAWLGQPGPAWAWISTRFSEGAPASDGTLVERLLLLWHGRNEPEFAHAAVMGQGLPTGFGARARGGPS